MDPSTLIVTTLIILITYAVYKAWRINKYWIERNVPHIKPWLFLGNSAEQLFLRKSAGEHFLEICEQFPNVQYIGYYNFIKPVIIIKDIELLERILIKDFMYFTDHGFQMNSEKYPFDSNLFLMSGRRWKAIRNKMSPLFTTGKLKIMFDSMKQCGDQLIVRLNKEIDQEIEMKDLLGRFAMDVIGSCAFGIDAEALTKPDSEFCRMAKKAFSMDLVQFMKLILLVTLTSVADFFRITFNKMDVKEYFCNIINETLKYRRDTGYKRNDFVQLMIQLQDKGYVEMQTKDPEDDYLNIESTYSTWKYAMSNEELTGHAFTFLTAGFDSITLTMQYALYELAKHPEIQKKLREEILREVKHAETFTYDVIKEMIYLDMCVKETLRKYPSSQTLMRGCTKDYMLPNGVTIHSGQKVYVPIGVIHYNPNYYPDPYQFQPERFAPDTSLPKCAFLSFGDGPRICIAMRFALLEIKYCLAKLLLNYSFEISNKTKEPLTINPKSLFTEPREKIIFNVKKIIV